MGNKLFASGVRKEMETNLWCPCCRKGTAFTYSKDHKKIGIKCTSCGDYIPPIYKDWSSARKEWIERGKVLIAESKRQRKLTQDWYHEHQDDNYQEGRALDYHERMFELFDDMGHGLYGSMLDD